MYNIKFIKINCLTITRLVKQKKKSRTKRKIISQNKSVDKGSRKLLINVHRKQLKWVSTLYVSSLNLIKSTA